MAFRFALASLLRFRESMEDREYLLLRNAQHEVASIHNQIGEMQQQRLAVIAACSSALTGGLIASELHAFAMQRQQIELMIEQLKKKLREAELRRDRQRKVYEAAHRKREALSIVRDRQQEAWDLQDGRRQQRQLDDLFLSRRKPEK